MNWWSMSTEFTGVVDGMLYVEVVFATGWNPPEARTSLPQNFGLAPEPYAPKTMGSATVPLELTWSCSRHSAPRWKRTCEPGVKSDALTFATDAHAVCGVNPSLASLPPA